MQCRRSGTECRHATSKFISLGDTNRVGLVSLIRAAVGRTRMNGESGKVAALPEEHMNAIAACPAGSRAVVVQRVWIIVCIVALASGSAAQATTIEIVSGTYGQNCGAQRGNATRDLNTQCDGRATCEYRVDRRSIPDPAVGCRKDFLAEWRCDETDVHVAMLSPEAGTGSTLVLGCVSPTGAGK